jgi:hypothetical protein
MVGGLARSRPPRELARDPEAWPEAVILGNEAASVVQDIARALAAALGGQERSLRQAAAGSGVNRQAIADLLAGRCWPDVATVARLENPPRRTAVSAPRRNAHRASKSAFPSPRTTRLGNDEIGHAPPEAIAIALTSGMREPLGVGPRHRFRRGSKLNGTRPLLPATGGGDVHVAGVARRLPSPVEPWWRRSRRLQAPFRRPCRA